MKCPKCQFENPSEMQFCGKCGAKLESICPQCNSSNPPEFNFCGKCGHKLREPQDAIPVDYLEPQTYTPKHLADKILTTRSSIEGERKLVTVLFADVANFTSISEKFDPEEIHRIMDGCFKILMEEIHRFEGTINQFTGDGIMALFGAPVAHEDHGQRACYAALSVQKAMGNYGEQLKKDCRIEFKMRVGLNSGPVVVGSIGDDLRMDYTAVGDTTNLAARLESMAGPGRIVLSSHTHRLVRDYFEFNLLGNFDVKGKKESQKIFELLGIGDVHTRMAASMAKGLTRFVGRNNAIGSLNDAYNKARNGSGQVVGVVGEAGVGKSRLLLEFRNQLPRGEFYFFEGQCLPFGGAMAYLPMLEIIRSYFKIKEGDPEPSIKKIMAAKILQLDDQLRGILAPFYDLLSLDPEDAAYQNLEPRQKRERTFEAIRDLLIYESQKQPLIIVVDDLHWIDRTSDEFLDYLIGGLTGARILLVLLYRPEYIHSWGSKSFYNRIGLEQLTSQSSAELIRSILQVQDSEAVQELKGFILERTAGNPLFMEELTHTLLENGSIQCEDGKCLLLENTAKIRVPDTIEGIIAARMDRLEDDIKRTMQVASVIGRDFSYRILEKITEMRLRLKTYLLNLQRLEFIYEKSLFPELEYVFKHALTREVAYNSVLQQRRKKIHEKIGWAIEALYHDRIEEFYEMLAHHYSKSDDFEKAHHYLELSGDKAMRNYSAAEAFHYYKDAISVLKKLPASEENTKRQLAIIHKMITPIVVLGFPEEGLSILQAGEKIAQTLDDKKSLIRFHGNMGAYYAFAGRQSEGRRYLEKGFEEAWKIQDVESMAQAGTDILIASLREGDYPKTIDLSLKITNLIEKTQTQAETFGGPSIVYPGMFVARGYGMAMLGDFEGALALCERGLEDAVLFGNRVTLGFSEFYYGMVLINRGEWETAKAHLENSIKHCEAVSFLTWLALAWSGLGQVEAELGNPEIGRNYVEEGLKIYRDAQIDWLTSCHLFAMGICHYHSGDLAKAIELMEEAYQQSKRNQEKHYTGKSLIWLGRMTGKTDSHGNNEAIEYVQKGLNILKTLQTKPDVSIAYLFSGEIYWRLGLADKASSFLKKSAEMFEEMGMDFWLDKTQEIMEQL